MGGFGLVFLAFAVLIVVRRQEIRETARDGVGDEEDLVTSALASGPADAFKEHALAGITRAIVRLPLGWVVLALAPIAVASVMGVMVWNLWHAGSPIEVRPPPGVESAHHYLMGAFEHVAAYLFFGALLIGAGVSFVRSRAERRLDLAVAGFAVLSLVAFVWGAGVWV
ncbi:MAG: hypothetical protein R2731_02325 [Nocardioides sp.]